jgi:hemerythrin-like domain-containing protein
MQSPSATRLIRQEHAALAAVLDGMQSLVQRGPQDDPVRFFDSVSAMLFYMDEFPERRHHPTESNLLFPMLARAAPESQPVIRRLEMDHIAGEGRVRELQHLLLAWRFLGDSRREKFARALHEYAAFYLKHMATEEKELLPLVATRLDNAQRAQLDAAFQSAMDPLVGGASEAVYAKLLGDITRSTRSPVGLGAA